MAETTWINVLTAATSVFALIAALAALAQAMAAVAGNRGNLFVAFSERYSSSKMRDTLALLAAWHHRHKAEPDRFAAWAKAKRSGDAEAKEINDARRFVSRYFYDVASLYEQRLIGRGFARALLANNGLNVFYQVCDELNRANQPLHRFKTQCDTLRSLRKKYGDGEIFEANASCTPRPAHWWVKLARFLHLRKD